MNDLIAVELRWGFWKYYNRLRLMSKPWNHKRIDRVYCQMRLNQKRRAKRRLVQRPTRTLLVSAVINAAWALDFMRDRLCSAVGPSGP